MAKEYSLKTIDGLGADETGNINITKSEIYKALISQNAPELNQTTDWGMIPGQIVILNQLAVGDSFNDMKVVNDINAFTELNQIETQYAYISCAYNGNIYAVGGSNIVMQTNGAGDFVDTGAPTLGWKGIACAPNGNIYACVTNGDIYMQTGGIGAFNALSQASRFWQAMTSAPNGDIYAANYSGDIYMQTSGAGDFNPLSTGLTYWTGMSSAANGDIYATRANPGLGGGDIYMQTGGIGAFNPLHQTFLRWNSISVSPYGDVYAMAYDTDNIIGSLYKRLKGATEFIATSDPQGYWLSIACAFNGNVYAGASAGGFLAGDIYMQIHDRFIVTAAGLLSMTWANASDISYDGSPYIVGTDINGDFNPFVDTVGGISFSRKTAGTNHVISTGKFKLDKMNLRIQQITTGLNFIRLVRGSNDDTLNLLTGTYSDVFGGTEVLADDILYNGGLFIPIEIEIFPYKK